MRADMFSSLLQKVKLKIENNVICDKKVLQHVSKYPQNSSQPFLLQLRAVLRQFLSSKSIVKKSFFNTSRKLDGYLTLLRLRCVVPLHVNFDNQNHNELSYTALFTLRFKMRLNYLS